MLNINNKFLIAIIFVALHSVDIYVCIDGNFSILPGVCPDIDSNYIPQWIKNNIDAHNKLCRPKKPLHGEYDFIIVGAGAAGSVIASRLSENRSVNVLLIEAGGCENATTDIPISRNILIGSQYDWKYIAEPQVNCFLNTYPDGRPAAPRGKSMGGSTAINGMLYYRGAPKDFGNWAKLGARGWNYSDVLPFFLLSEGNTDPNYVDCHNCCGPLLVSSNALDEPSSYLIEPCEQLGFTQIDLNGCIHRIGCDYIQQIIYNGTRHSVSKAFLEPVYNDRPNLHILAHSQVTRVLFQSRQAYGVEYLHHNRSYTVNASKEVILSAGVVGSPQILLLSGIGPREQLENLTIPVVAELNGVGENLYDHPVATGPGVSFNESESIDEICDNYLTNRSGRLAHYDGQCLNVKSVINNDEDWNDLQVCFPFGYSLSTHTTGGRIIVVNVRPKSVGWIKLRSADPLDHPLIQPNYLTHPDDILVLMDGLRWAFRIVQTNGFKNMSYNPFQNLVAGCETNFSLINDTVYPNMSQPSDDYLECVARRTTTPCYHLSGTCKMGSPHDSMAVVSPRLKLRGGIRRLRVADSSVMPVVTNANTMAPSVVIGEKCAQFVKDEYNI